MAIEYFLEVRLLVCLIRDSADIFAQAFANTTAVTNVLTTSTPTPSASRSHITSTLTDFVSVTVNSNATFTTPPTVAITLPPCCTILQFSEVGLAFWYPSPVTVTTAVVTSMCVQKEKSHLDRR